MTRQAQQGLPAAIYARISKDRAGAGLGVDRQKADCRELAKRLGWQVVATFIDNDISAYSAAPSAVPSMLDAVRCGPGPGLSRLAPRPAAPPDCRAGGFIDLLDTHRLRSSTVTAGDLDLTTALGADDCPQPSESWRSRRSSRPATASAPRRPRPPRRGSTEAGQDRTASRPTG